MYINHEICIFYIKQIIGKKQVQYQCERAYILQNIFYFSGTPDKKKITDKIESLVSGKKL